MAERPRVTFKESGIACGRPGGSLHIGDLRCEGCGKQQHVIASWPAIQAAARNHVCVPPGQPPVAQEQLPL